MSETSYFPSEEGGAAAASHPAESREFKEAVCIDAMRVYDSCGEMHCTRYTRQKKTPAREILPGLF